jgi:hypothetical protein
MIGQKKWYFDIIRLISFFREFIFLKLNLEVNAGIFRGQSTTYGNTMMKTSLNVCNLMKASGLFGGIFVSFFKKFEGFDINNSCPIKKKPNVRFHLK